MRCESCGLEAPTKAVQLHQNIGMLAMRRYQSIKGNLCRPCIDNYFWRFTLVNSVLGWWGLISLFVTPLFIINNVFQFLTSRGLSASSIGVNSLPTYVANPHSAQVQCPHCQSYQTQATKLSGAILASLVGAGLLLVWGLYLELAVYLHRTSSGNLVVGLLFIGIALFALLSLWMIMGNRMWECQQCRRVWVARRN